MNAIGLDEVVIEVAQISCGFPPNAHFFIKFVQSLVSKIYFVKKESEI